LSMPGVVAGTILVFIPVMLQSGRLSVNTQDDNVASLRLYSKLGFLRTGEHYPVFIHSLGAS
ncbi:MAG TPA: hypothetical protein PKI33_13880, partial [Anaerolineales bacterium]|nr:hypothetical protein [Anaerolineales bacterium]